MGDSNKDFCHLHLHTDHSLLDGACRIDRLTQRAAELGFTSLAMTDHGNLFGAMAFYKGCQKAGIKPIIGCEIYLVHDHKMSEKPRRDKRKHDDINDVPEHQVRPEDFPANQIHHKTLLASTFEGYQNLSRMISEAHINGMYYRPRVDVETMAKYSKGIIGLSGCVNGVAPQYLIYNNYDKAREATAQMIDIFGKDNYYIELQDHGLSIQQRIIPGLLRLAKEFGLKTVCANDVHYVNRGDWEPHDALLCIQTGKRVADEDRMKYPSQEFYLKSRAEMQQLFSEVPESVTNTLEVAEKCNVKITFGENHYPRYERPAEIQFKEDPEHFNAVLDIYVTEKNKVLKRQDKDLITLTDEERTEFLKNGTYLFDLCKQGLNERYGVDYDAVKQGKPIDENWKNIAGKPHCDDPEFPQKVCAQLEYELAIIAGAGFVDYFLIVWDFIAWARNQGIPVGPGRGSGAGCIVAYVLKITDIDPLRFGLLFERMLSLERVSPPDFDVDFCMRRRDDVVNFVREKYGHDHVANIITFGTFGAKMVVRDVARVLDLPYAEADRIAKMVPDELNISLDDALEKSPELQQEVKVNPIARSIFEHGKVIEGMVRNTGKHACGVIIGDQPLTNLVPLTKQEGDLTTQYPKGPVEDLGMLKCDFLGLKTLTVISDAQDNVRSTTKQKAFDIERVSLEDGPTYDLLNSGHTMAVFQLESGGMQDLCRKIGLSKFEEIIALIALYRPGPMEFIPQFIRGKKDPSTVEVPHPLLKELVSETYGVLVYQEQVMKAAQIISGYTLGDADLLRRAMGKKIAEVMAQQKDIFVAGAERTNGIDKKTAEHIFGILEKFAKYGFNKSHSAAYAMLSYRTAYLKANYPVQFMAAVLSAELGNSDNVKKFIAECEAMKIPVLGPDVNESGSNFTPVMDGTGDSGGSIRFGMGAIKGVGDAAALAIMAEREAEGPYQDLVDFVCRVDSKQVNRRVIEALIKTGGFDSTGHDRGHLLQSLDAVMSEAAIQAKERESGQTSLFDMMGGDDLGSQAEMTGDLINTSTKPMSMTQKLEHEKNLLGFYVSGHPLDDFEGFDLAVNSFKYENQQKLDNNEAFRLCGIITSIIKRYDKNNRAWAFISFATRDGQYSEIPMFADAWEHISKFNQFGRKLPHLLDNTDEDPEETLDVALEEEEVTVTDLLGQEVKVQTFNTNGIESQISGTAVADAPEVDDAATVPLLREGAVVLIHGQARMREDTIKLNINEILPLRAALSNTIQDIQWLLHTDKDTTDFLHKLRDYLNQNEGIIKMGVNFLVDGDKVLSAEVATSLSGQFNPKGLRALRQHPAVAGIAVNCKDIPVPTPRWQRKRAG